MSALHSGSLIGGLIPVAGVIALGWTLRRTGLVPEELWAGVTRLSYQALLPALLFATIARADTAGLPAGRFLLAMTAGFLVMAALAALAGRVVPMSGPAFTSVFQGGLRINGFVVFALAQASFPPEGVALVALMFAVMVPLVNGLAVGVLAAFGEGAAAPGVRVVARRVATNPLIVGCAAGLIGAAVGADGFASLMDTADLVGRAALPLILLAVGASLDFGAVRAAPRLLALTVLLKLVMAPLVFAGLASLAGAEGAARTTLVAIGAAPCAASAYVLAREMGGDARLMAGAVTATTVLAFAALPAWVGLLG